MKKSLPFYIALLILPTVYTAYSQFHTSPKHWEKPRTFQTPISQDELDAILDIQKVSNQIDTEQTMFEEKIFSPNNAYWYGWHNIEIGSGNQQGSIYIFNEKNKLIKISFTYYANFGVNTKWINEKLLYTRIWRGRVVALDIIYDVEKESIMYSENTHDGLIPYQQFQQKK